MELYRFETKSFYHPYNRHNRQDRLFRETDWDKECRIQEYDTSYIDYQYNQNGHCTMVDYLYDIPKES